MKQLFTTAKKRLRYSIIDFNPSVADSIGTGEEFEAFLRSVQACCYNSEFRGALANGRTGNFGDYFKHSAHTLLGANE